LLTQPFFLNESEWFRVPEWRPSIVRGKGYDLQTEAGKFIWRKIESLMAGRKEFYLEKAGMSITEERERYGKGILIKPRLGQGSFRIFVTDAYNRSCAVTQERALPVLEAAHIKPFSAHGPHDVKNGILLRSDMHRLFDTGYMTITPQLHIEVSRRIKEEFENGKYYYTFHGKKVHPPQRLNDRPAPEFLSWHNENVFRD